MWRNNCDANLDPECSRVYVAKSADKIIASQQDYI